MDVDRNKLFATAKRLWGQTKKEIVYSDKISADESAVLKMDDELMKLLVRRQELENDIVQRVEGLLYQYRSM